MNTTGRSTEPRRPGRKGVSTQWLCGWLVGSAGVLAGCIVLPPESLAGEPGDFDAAQFGTAYVVDKEGAAPRYSPAVNDGSGETSVDIPAGGAIQIEWRHPRDVHVVRASFTEQVPSPESVVLAYWYHVWPDNGAGGWMKVDDPFNGRFVNGQVEAVGGGERELRFRFKPLTQAENSAVKAVGSVFRRTYKVRLSFKTGVKVSSIECLTDSVWKTALLSIRLPMGHRLKAVEPRNAGPVGLAMYRQAWAGVHVRYADNVNRLSADRGYLVVRQDPPRQDFSFFIDDVIREGRLRVRDIEAVVSEATSGLPQGPSADVRDATVVEKVARMPEQTRERATTDIPAKWIPVAHLGLPNLRQEISIDERSEIYTEYRSLRSPGPDRDRSPNLSEEHPTRTYVRITRKEPFGPPGPKRIKRWLEEGYLPIIHSAWEDDGIKYHQTIYVTTLDPAQLAKVMAIPSPASAPIGSGIRAADFGSGPVGEEAVVAMCRLEIENPAAKGQTATMWLKISERPPMAIASDGLLVLDPPTRPRVSADLTPTWGQIDVGSKGELKYLKDYFPRDPSQSGDSSAAPALVDKPPVPPEPNAPAGTGSQQNARKAPRDVIQYSIALDPGAKHSIVMKVPYIEQLSEAEVAHLRARDWGTACEEIARLWKARLAKAIDSYHVPDPALESLYRANLWHVLITTDRDPRTGLYEHGAGTYDYPVYANETMMVVRSLEMRGEHEEARRMIEPCLLSQGDRALPGNFKTKEGLLYATAPPKYDHYTAQGYNMHHGFILWAAAEHYFWTGDKAYLAAIAPNLVAGCDWITRERKATMVLDPDGTRPIEWGLAPAGDLEDVEEYLYWYATNAYYYLGMVTAARALADIGHPEASRLAGDAEAYARDIMASVRESTATSPVVRLLDGSYVPYVPPRAYALTDRKEGWIREALYCSLHLVDCGLLEPGHPFTDWILQGLEDRIFMSSESGYGPEHGLKSPHEQFFSFGGFNPQPNLLDNSIVYLRRDQIPNFLRAFWNTYAMSIYPDVQCFAESVSFGMGGGPLYKTPDECKFIQWMREMLLLESGDDLHVGRGVPRAWMADGKEVVLKAAPTFFGPVDLKIASAVSQGEIRADLSLSTRRQPETVHVYFRHPEGRRISSVTVNGQEWTEYDVPLNRVSIRNTRNKLYIVALY